MNELAAALPGRRVWSVSALIAAVAEVVDTGFAACTVRGEISGFSRASSGHCYFALKDSSGQLRCAMFRRAAGLLDFSPRDGDQVEVRGRLAVYEPRGDLQLVVESLQRAGQGALFEQFLQRKARLEAEGLFDPERKRALPVMGWTEAADLIISSMEKSIASKKVTYDFARLMDGATQVSCSGFGQVMIDHM